MSKTLLRARRSILGLALLGLSAGAFANDANWPNRPIRLLLPFPAGGTTDALARMLAPRLSEQLKGTVIVDNKGGAATLIGTMEVVRSPADGYTLLMTGPSTFTANPAVNPQLPYDPVKSFDYIGLTGSMPVILLAGTRAPYADLGALVKAAKGEPGKHFYGSFGAGSIMHFAGESLNAAAGIKLTSVPYKGSSPAMADLMGNQIPLTFDTVTVAAPQVRAGKVRALAVTSAQRSAIMPEVPTAREAGFAMDISSWVGIAAPAGLPPAVRAKLEAALAAVVSDPGTQKAMLAMGVEPAAVGADAFRKKVETEYASFRKLAVDNNIKPD